MNYENKTREIHLQGVGTLLFAASVAHARIV